MAHEMPEWAMTKAREIFAIPKDYKYNDDYFPTEWDVASALVDVDREAREDEAQKGKKAGVILAVLADKAAYLRGVADAVAVAERFGIAGSVIGAMAGLGVISVEEVKP